MSDDRLIMDDKDVEICYRRAKEILKSFENMEPSIRTAISLSMLEEREKTKKAAAEDIKKEVHKIVMLDLDCYRTVECIDRYFKEKFDV